MFTFVRKLKGALWLAVFATVVLAMCCVGLSLSVAKGVLLLRLLTN